jgi:cell wall-associated NlpC family hydrolase
MAVDWNAMYGYAQSLLGTPYQYGATGSGGFDCSGFTQAVYASQGLNIGRDTSAQLRSGATIGQDGNWAADVPQLQPGDLIFYGAPGASGPNAHVVMYIGNGRVIQAGGRSVNVTSLFQSASPTTPFLGVRRYTQMVNSPAQMSMTGGGAAGGLAPPPGLNDIPALDTYIRQNYPSEAWLLDVPEVKQTLEQGVVAGLTSDQLQAKLQNTAWWQHTSQAQIKFLDLQHSTPEELNFGNPGSKASQALAHVQTLAASSGVGLPAASLKQIALQSLQYGWNDDQVSQRLGSMAWVKTAGRGVTSNDPTVLAQLTALAGKYLYNPTADVLNTYAQGLASKTMTPATFQAFLAQQAAAKYPYMASQITAGQTPDQIVDPLRQEAARIMEVAPGQVNFLSDPFYAKVLAYQPPAGAGGKQQPVRMMSTSEMDTYLRGSDQWGHTQAARDQAAAVAKSITSTFGKVKS